MGSGYVLIRTVVAFHSASVCSFAFGTRVPIGHYTAMFRENSNDFLGMPIGISSISRFELFCCLGTPVAVSV